MNNPQLNINYIRHLNAFYTLVHEHERLRSNDISLYMALFQLWNQQRFPVSLMVSRKLITKLSKIGSYKTYVQCLKRLDSYGLLTYQPSERPFEHSVIKMLPLEKNEPHKHVIDDPHMCSNKDPDGCSNADPHPGSILHHFNNKQINNYINERQTGRPQKKKINEIGNPVVPELEEVRAYFSTVAQPEREADQFYFHYKAIGWTLSGMPIFDWKAAAEKWISHIPLLKKNINDNTKPGPGGIRPEENKRYDEPF
jgi:hypothetical protein